MVNKKQICIDVEEYLNLVNAREKLILLECGGVDNWSWYSESLEDYKEAIDVKKVDGELVLEYYEDCDI